MNLAWIYVVIGALFEVGWVTGFKHAHDFMTWTGTVICIILSFGLLLKANTMLPVATAYAVFTGLGTVGTVILEMVVFGEPFKIIKVLLILLLLTGVIGLKLVTGKPNEDRGVE